MTGIPLNASIYIGVTDKVGDNAMSSYKWVVDGSDITAPVWHPTQPDQTNQRCGIIFLEEAGGLHHFRCNLGSGGLCEADLRIRP